MTETRSRAPVRQFIQEIRRDPSLAEFAMSATASVPERGMARAVVRAHPSILADEDAHLGGEDLAPNPSEYLLSAIAMCQVVTYQSIARALGIPLDAIEVTASGALDWRGSLGMERGIPVGFLEIECEARLRSPADPERIRRLAERVERYCAVSDTIRRPVALRESVILNGEPLTNSAD